MMNLNRAVEYNKQRGYSPATWKDVQVMTGCVMVDGIPGEETALCVAEWQDLNGLTPDGMVGPATLGAMGRPKPAFSSHRRPRAEKPLSSPGCEDPYYLPNMVALYPHRAFGIDVSAYQDAEDKPSDDINWQSVSGAGAEWCIVKLTEGRTHQNGNRHANWDGAISAGLAVSGYHLANLVHNGQETDAVGGAANFINELRNMSCPEDFPCSLDLEFKKVKEHIDHTGDPRLTLDWIERWIAHFESLYGYRPMIYLSGRTANLLTDHGRLPLDHTWWADYNKDTWGQAPKVGSCGCWRWTFRQITGSGKVPGIQYPCDIGYFHGSSELFHQWVRTVEI